MPKKYIKTYLSDVYKTYKKTGKLNHISEYDLIYVDTYLLNNTKGAFKHKTISANKVLKLIKPKTILEQAQHNLLECYVSNKVLSIDPLVLPTDSFIHECYRKQTTDNKVLSAYILESILNKCRNEAVAKLPTELYNWIDIKTYTQKIDDAITNIKNNSKVRQIKNTIGYLPNCIASDLATLKDLFKDLDVEFHVGHAGCGKSTTVSKYLTAHNLDTCQIISLSNTICNMFKQKVPRIETCSLCRAKYCTVKRTDVVVIDEFSQVGFEWVPTLIKIIEANKNSKFFIMGDIDQIPTFLSSGSILYSCIKQFPEKIVEHNTNYRFMNNGINTILDNVINRKPIVNLVVNNLDSLSSSQLASVNCCITGTNDHVNLLNFIMIRNKFSYALITPNMSVSDIVKTVRADVELICKTNIDIGGYKCSRNERFKCTNVGLGQMFMIESEVTGNSTVISAILLDCNFELGYAITVNRAQGLEWDNILVYADSRDMNLLNVNALYVALSRGKNSLLVCSGSNNGGKILTANFLSNIVTNTQYKFINNFME